MVNSFLKMDHAALAVKAMELQEACVIYDKLIGIEDIDWDGKCEASYIKARILSRNEHH